MLETKLLPTEIIQGIGESILNHGTQELEFQVTDFAVARIAITIENVKKNIWLFNRDGNEYPGIKSLNSSLGNVCTSKHREFGRFLLINRLGKGIYRGQTVEVHDISSYRYEAPGGTYNAVNGKIELLNEPDISFVSLRSFLKSLLSQESAEALRNDQLALENLGLAREELLIEADSLLLKYISQEEDLLSSLRAKQRYIRDTNLLRLNPILDQKQSKIMGLRVGNGVLIIDGGPGTGKTTTLIQRIHFLTQKGVLFEMEEVNISNEVLSSLDGPQGWLFISPSELLKSYLQNAMSDEGLRSGESKMKVWDSHLDTLFRSYGMFPTVASKKSSFRKVHSQIDNLLPNEWPVIEMLMQSFDRVWIDLIKQKANVAVPTLNDKDLNLLRQKLAASLRGSSEIDEWLELYRFFINYRTEYSSQLQVLFQELKELINKASSQATILLMQNNQAVFHEIANWALQGALEDVEKNIGDDIDDDDDDEDEEEVPVQGEKEAVMKKMKGWIQNYAMLSLKKGHSVKQKQKEFLDKIENYIPIETLPRIGELSFLRKGYRKLTDGPDKLMMKVIPQSYKELRKKILTGDIVTDERIINGMRTVDSKGKDRLHPDEMNFLFAWINRKAKAISLRFPKHFFESKDTYVLGYKDAFRYNIVVDEASDFSLIELIAMESLTDASFRSMTLCGDLMQRMTSKGIDEWDSFIQAVEGQGEIHELRISYRQTPTLLRIAKAMYKAVLGKEALYEANAVPSESEPKPWLTKLSNIESMCSWLSVEAAVTGGFKLGVKLVRGAYMEKERERANKLGYLSPINDAKKDTDHEYNNGLRFCIDHIESMVVVAGTHNNESIQLLMTLMEEKRLPRNSENIFFSQLYGMGDILSYNLSKVGYNVCKYLPFGPVKDVIPYLTRRARENSSVNGFTSQELTTIINEIKRRRLVIN